MRAYLVGFIMVTGLTMGCTAILMLYHVVGGKWGVPVMRIYEAGSRNWLLMVLSLFPSRSRCTIFIRGRVRKGLTCTSKMR